MDRERSDTFLIMPPRPKKASLKSSNKLLDAVSFLSCITKEIGTPQDTHIYLGNGVCTASNGTLSAGIIIDEEIICAPNASIFKKALSKCGQEYTLTIDGSKIIIKSGKFKAVVPCIDPGLLGNPFPDVAVAPIDDRFKEAMACADIIKAEPNSEHLHLLAFLMNGQSVVSTDGKIILEFWHGIDLPTIAIPKSIIPAILNNSKKLTQFGFSKSSVTFYFEDKSWVKSQLYNKEWPIETTQNILNKNCNPSPIPVDFYPGLEAVVGFSETGSVYFDRDKICSHKVQETGSTFEVAGLPKGPIYTAKYLQMIKPLAEKIDFAVSANDSVHSENVSGYLLFWFGKNVRGVIAGHG